MARRRSPTNALLRLLESSPAPIYAVDDNRRIIYCNRACAAWLEVDPHQLVGQTCYFQSAAAGSPAERMAAALCPPPPVMLGKSQSGVIQCAAGGGGAIKRQAEFLALGGDDFAGVSALVIVSSQELSGQEEPLVEETEAEWLHRRLRLLRARMAPRCRVDHLLGESSYIRRTQAQLQAAMATRHSVLVSGPPGTHSEQTARAVYYGQHPCGAAGPLVPLSCTLLDAELLQTTIREVKTRKSDLEKELPAALLLLDVDALSQQTQAELLGFLQLPQFELHTISTSQTPLHQLLESASFSTDLANLLASATVEIPPLSKRPEDIPLLAQCCLERQNAVRDRQFMGFTPEATDVLVAYSWPGEFEELEQNVAEAALSAEGSFVKPSDLAAHLHWSIDEAAHQQKQEAPLELDQVLIDVETELLRQALRKAKGNKAQAARQLGISRARLLRRMAFLGVA